MDLAWYLRRLRRMSPGEVGTRLRAAAIQQAWRFGANGGPAVGAVAWAGVPLRGDRAVDAATIRRLMEAADAVLAGRWNVFGRNFDTSIADPDWHRDVRSGLRFDPARYCFDVPYRAASRVGNVKSLWEPSRLHHVTLLAAAFNVSGDTRYAERAAEHLHSWWRANPPLRGIHWISGIELGMRLIAWVWTRRLLADWPGVEALFERNSDFLRQLHHHSRWLAALYSRGSSANNHLIAEAAGLFIASTAFHGPQSEAWARLAQGILEEEAVAQTFPDGLNREMAFGYHGYVLGLLLLAGVEGEAAGHPMSGRYWRSIVHQSDALAANLGDEMLPPRQGDGDDAWALMLDPPEQGPWAPLLELAAAEVGARDWWPAPQGQSVLAVLVPQIANPRPIADPRQPRRPNRFADAGITFLRDDVISCRVDHGPHGFLATSAHGHADALSFELRIGGRPVLIDPGTYAYQGEPEWRRYFRSTIAHNTLEIENADQAGQAGPFLWSSQMASWVEGAHGIDDGAVADLTVAHDGYRRLPVEATHVRHFRLDRTTHALTIIDAVEAKAPVAARLAYHVHPAVTVKTEAGAVQLLAEDRLLATLALPEGLAWQAHRADETPRLGWYSAEFGAKQPCVSLVGSGMLAPGQRLETRISTTDTAPRHAAARGKEVTV